MKYVEIYKLQNDGEQKIIATCKLVDVGVECSGDEIFVKNLVEQGIKNYADLTHNETIFPKDGILFLENLKHAFKSGYLQATDVLETKK